MCARLRPLAPGGQQQQAASTTPTSIFLVPLPAFKRNNTNFACAATSRRRPLGADAYVKEADTYTKYGAGVYDWRPDDAAPANAYCTIVTRTTPANTPILYATLSPVGAKTHALNPTPTILNTQHHHYTCTPILYAILSTAFES